MQISRQIDELKSVADGWLEGAGKKPSENGLNWLMSTLTQHFPHRLPLPSLYPVASGDVLAEWSIGKMAVSLEIDLRTHDGEWHALDLESGDAKERTFQCDNDEDWKWLSGELEAMVRGSR